VKSIDDTLTYFTAGNMLGKVYLIDFWATWCGSCVEQMPYLNIAYERFAKRGFTILSISRDRSKEDVVHYRKRRWKMPWLNAYIGFHENDPLVTAFGAWGIPFPVLVDAKGKIVAVGYDELLGEHLEQTIERCLGKK
jgi:thiol-disulfide isomerase/thioredoxin